MGAKGEALAKKFEAKVQEATGVIEKLSDGDWKKITSAEKWSVGVTAHHIAMAHAGLIGIVKTIADGKPGPNIPMEALHQMNAKHAQDFASCTKADTLALHTKNAADAAAALRGIGDDQFGRSATVLAGNPVMSAEQFAGVLCSHVDEHLGSIRATIAK